MIRKIRSGQSPARGLQTFLQMHVWEHLVHTASGHWSPGRSHAYPWCNEQHPSSTDVFGYLHRCQPTQGSHPGPRSWGCFDTKLMMEAMWGTEHTARAGAGDETGRAGMAAIRGTFSNYKVQNQCPSSRLTLPQDMPLLSQQQAVKLCQKDYWLCSPGEWCLSPKHHRRGRGNAYVREIWSSPHSLSGEQPKHWIPKHTCKCRWDGVGKVWFL